MKHACVFDWDGTLRHGITTLDWMEFLSPSLPYAQTASLGMRDLIDDYRAGEVNYRYLVRKAADLYARCIADASVSEVTKLATLFVQQDKKNLFGFTCQILDAAKQRGHEIFIISGAPVEVLFAYAEVVEIDHVFGLTVEFSNGSYTKNVTANYGLMGKKKEAIDRIRADGFTIVLAAGNSTSDLPLLEYARHRFLISNEQEIKQEVQASFIDTQHAHARMLEAL